MGINTIKNKGLTLVELLTAMAVLSILSAVSIPAIINYLPKYRLEAAADQLFSTLQRAKQEAVKSNGECTVYFDTKTGSYQLVGAGPDGICDGPPAGTPPLPQNDDILLYQVFLAHHGTGLQYGSGRATRSVPGHPISASVTVSYHHDWVRFNAKGLVHPLGYIYLTNRQKDVVAVGTPSLAGTIVKKKWMANGWH